MELWTWIVVGVAAAVALVALLILGGRLVVGIGRRRRHRQELEERFGPEYARAVTQGGRKHAEDELDSRLSTYEQLDHPTLGPSEREERTAAWRRAQFHFVDSPERAVWEAEHIVVSVMQERGFPTDDASVRADALSVDAPELASAYRAAHTAFRMADHGNAGLDQLLGAFLVYREVFEYLLARPKSEATTFDVEPPSALNEPLRTRNGVTSNRA
jgi:hypothetical protein